MTENDDSIIEKQLLESIKGKKVLLLPRMADKNLDNRDDPTSPMYKLIKVAEFLECAYTFDLNSNYDIVIGRWSGDDLTTEGTVENNIFKQGKLFLELSWCPLNGFFFFDRYSKDDKIEDVKTLTTYFDKVK